MTGLSLHEVRRDAPIRWHRGQKMPREYVPDGDKRRVHEYAARGWTRVAPGRNGHWWEPPVTVCREKGCEHCNG